MAIEILTELQYSTDREGPFKMYIYEPNSEYHRGGVWFQDKPKYPEEGEIPTGLAHNKAFVAVAQGREVRICDGGDMLVFHARNGKVIYGENFWHEVGEKSTSTTADVG